MVGTHTNNKGRPTDADIDEKKKRGRIQKNITSVIIKATISSISQARNSKIFTSQTILGMQTIQHIKDQVQNTILFINTSSTKYSKYKDKTLGQMPYSMHGTTIPRIQCLGGGGL